MGVLELNPYYDVEADELYKSFYDIETVFPEKYLTKTKKKGSEWEKSDVSVEASDEIKVEIIPLTELKDFRRKLIIVLPPGYNLELLNKNKISAKPC